MCLVLVAVILLVQSQARLLVDRQVVALHERVLSTKKQELKNYIEIALTSVAPALASRMGDAATEAKIADEVKSLLGRISFTEDGYFFIYDMNGVSIMHPRQSWREGENWLSVRDKDGVYLIRDLIAAARAGGGFVQYYWERPTTGKRARKISYAVSIERFGWMLGTGVYIDEIEELVAALRSDVEDRVRAIFIVISLIVAASVTGVGLLVSGLAYRETSFANTALRHLYNRMVDAQEEERARVSRDLHGGISQLLVSAKFALGHARSRMPVAQDGTAGNLGEGFALIDDAIEEVHRISADLRPKDLDDLGLAAAIRSLGERFAKTTRVPVHVSALPVNDAISQDQKSALYRIAQEALTNIQRHASATQVEIRLERTSSEVVLEVRDNGAGIDAREGPGGTGYGGLGLRNMEERLGAFSGALSVRGRERGGTVLRAVMPTRAARGTKAKQAGFLERAAARWVSRFR
ncbi:cache domain-containing protein [Roseovarius atlanticus]|uniref:cache domain-containing protein n=1 Tax=Roseovarius atlanticus TaxID=1641875 RepID=UPI001C946A0E|nr:cache domain-containing protein [Roseovarius atlanticus]MBY5989125.1 cache domain-containing protein [Roseovarius atlanticus]MBY6124517.1 cache domain-containing protein [Roseovarius atlanticus]MBY6149012.1 cache domain-containing protein [Roseovarius atlanticus]